MTKVGEGKDLPKGPTIETYHKEIDQSSMKFLNALDSYKIAASSEERQHLKGIMDQQLALIREAVGAMKQAGIYKQEAKVEKDYDTYMNHDTVENLTTLEEDLTTLREYNQLK
ncbi:MAG: hypothetical protein V4487_03310 [Chlamydiota bacterium]